VAARGGRQLLPLGRRVRLGRLDGGQLGRRLAGHALGVRLGRLGGGQPGRVQLLGAVEGERLGVVQPAHAHVQLTGYLGHVLGVVAVQLGQLGANGRWGWPWGLGC
jgi:hypothetical protein